MSAFFNSTEIDKLFGKGSPQLPLPMTKIDGARVLWLNERAARHDPAFAALGNSLEAYERSLLDTCAFRVSRDESEVPDHIGYADRYGGVGISRNGGSGRAMTLGNYHVKGVGRTPLLSTLADPAHASGGAYLEECAREAIWAEIVQSEFPHGAIPVLAIIDTGEHVVWQTNGGPKSEQKCLLVRPSFIRPAHFERAIGFYNGQPDVGQSDARRVMEFFQAAIDHWGRETLQRLISDFWIKWARQSAHGFVHRMTHGGTYSSNVALTGELVDFGAMSALPSWARASMMFGAPPTGTELSGIVQHMRASVPTFAAHLDTTMMSESWFADRVGKVATAYDGHVQQEVLHLVGLPKGSIERFSGHHAQHLRTAVNRLVQLASRERTSMVYGTPLVRRPWNIVDFWASSVPAELRELRVLVDANFSHDERDSAADRIGFTAATRPELFREEMKSWLYHAVEQRPTGHEVSRTAVAAGIRKGISNRMPTLRGDDEVALTPRESPVATVA